MSRVVVLGASGFVGNAVTADLQADGHEVVRLRAPRISPTTGAPSAAAVRDMPEVPGLAAAIAGAAAVVNAAGDPDASSTDLAGLRAANAVLPGVVAAAVAQHPGMRLVQISSAVVQGRQPTLDSGPALEGFSAYSRSKAEGERLALALAPGQCVVYRPPSVHAADRRVTRMIARIASSPLATVATPGSQPSPQALLPNVASAVAFLATTDRTVPDVVAHPSEGLTASSTMELLGGRRPHRIPRALASGACGLLRLAGGRSPGLAANARRVELLWLGQAQAPSWLTEAGWRPVAGTDVWADLGRQVRSQRRNNTTFEEK